jgi:hypothetical protein
MDYIKEIAGNVDKLVEKRKKIVENYLLLGLHFCAKVVQNLAAIILPDKSIIWTLEVPSERYSRQVQKCTKVVLQNA